MSFDYTTHDATALAALVRGGDLSPEELLQACEARVQAHNPRLNAVIVQAFDQAREELALRRRAGTEREGALAGVPVLVKDLVSSVRGLATWHGNRLLQRVMPPADHDSAFIERLRATGALIVGKTSTPEFGLVPYTEPLSTGPTRNPWDLDRTPGGSSGGSGAAVAARLVPLATGGDGGGSIRIPAACCGLFGLKPTRGRVPTGPDFSALWSGFAIEHALTRSVRDSAALLDAVAGADAGAPYAAPSQARPFVQEVQADPGRLRVGVCTTPWLGHQVDPACVRAVEETAALLRELGHEVFEASLPIAGTAFAEAFLTVLAGHVRAEIEEAAALARTRAQRHDFEAATWAMGMMGRAFRADEFVAAERALQRTARAIGRAFEDMDLLLTPTLASPAPPVGALQPTAAEQRQLTLMNTLNQPWLLRAAGALQQMAGKVFEFIPYTPPFNVTGQPAMSLPMHWTDAGLPVGVQVVGRFGDEATLFRVAGQLERARPWEGRRPPGC